MCFPHRSTARLGLATALGLAVALLGYAARPPASSADADQPNIVLFVADDLGYGETGCQGNPEIPTPHIDSLARDGVRFTAGYVTASYCSPSRAALMMGRYQTRFGYEFNPVGIENEDPRVGLPPGELTLADLLRRAGYATALIGKWHLGGTSTAHPRRHGFDEFFGFLHEGHFYVPPPWRGVTTMLRRRALPDGGTGRWLAPDGGLIWSTHMGQDEPPYDTGNPILRDSQPTTETLHLTDAFTREAIDFIDRRHSQPFLLWLSYNAVHSPLQGDDRWMRQFASIDDVHRRIFAAMLGHLDESVGQVLAKLDREGLTDRTLVFFLSDNGGPTRELTSSNAPLRGGKGDVYEGGLRVPFLLRWPGRVPSGVAYDAPVISTDIFATVLAAAAVTPPARPARDGVDLLPFLRGERTGVPHPTLFWRMGNRAALRDGNWKLLRHRPDRWELYDLAEDPAEQTDLAERRPEQLAALKETWTRLDAEMAPPRWSRAR